MIINKKTGEITELAEAAAPVFDDRIQPEPAGFLNEVPTQEYGLQATPSNPVDGRSTIELPIFPSDVELYRRVKYELPTVERQLAQRLEALVAGDAEAQRLQEQVDAFRESVRYFDETVTTAIPPEVRTQAGTVRLAVMGVEITWPTPSVRFVMEHSLKHVYETEPTLAKALGIRMVQDEPKKPTIRVK